MSDFDWKQFLTNWGKQILEQDDIASDFPLEIRNTGWLGFSPASEKQLQEVERRLRISLPPSYREFLKVSNGWREAGFFIHKLWSVNEIEWYAIRHQDTIDAWLKEASQNNFVFDEDYFVYGVNQSPYSIREEYLQTALEISEDDESGDGVCLLNPKVIFDDGEWEAWFFANWIPGARRYKSFEEMLLSEYQIFLSTQKR